MDERALLVAVQGIVGCVDVLRLNQLTKDL